MTRWRKRCVAVSSLLLLRSLCTAADLAQFSVEADGPVISVCSGLHEASLESINPPTLPGLADRERLGRLSSFARSGCDFLANPPAETDPVICKAGLGSELGWLAATHPPGSDAFISKRIQDDGIYEWINAQLVAVVLKAEGMCEVGGLVVDVGANIGQYSMLALAAGCSVVAFEPVARNMNLLLLSAWLNDAIPDSPQRAKFASRLHPYRLALGERRAQNLSIVSQMSSNMGAVLVSEEADMNAAGSTEYDRLHLQHAPSVDMCTLDSVFDDDELRMKTERLVRGLGKSETTDIEARCATVVGKTVSEALQTEIIGVDSTVRKYSRADLDYDLARGLLVIEEHRPILLKLDVEGKGAKQRVLNGAIGILPRVSHILIEFEGEWNDTSLLDFLSSEGFTGHWLRWPARFGAPADMFFSRNLTLLQKLLDSHYLIEDEFRRAWASLAAEDEVVQKRNGGIGRYGKSAQFMDSQSNYHLPPRWT